MMETRKHTRLKDYDYSQPGAYYITVCVKNRRSILSAIVGRGLAPADRRPTVCDAVCAWKSLSAARCRKQNLQGALWQTSFYDHVIRDEQDYIIRAEYIENNPARWAEDEYYS